jgi:hypothetical protein
MKMGYRWAVRFATTVGLALVVSVSWAGQSSQASESPSKKVPPTKAWTPPRTPWGDPDLQGLWPGTDFVGVPLVRADSLGTRNELTDTEFTARLAAAQKQTEDDNAEFDISNVPPEVVARGTVGGPVSDTATLAGAR